MAIEQLEAERRALEAVSDLLKALTLQLAALEEELTHTERQLDERKDKRSKTEQKISAAGELREQARDLARGIPADASRWFAALAAMREEALGGSMITVES